jgi:hypothetical protein
LSRALLMLAFGRLGQGFATARPIA